MSSEKHSPMPSEQPDHWDFFQLPPFFTQQPAPLSLERQITLWGSLILDHATYHAKRRPVGACPVLRCYSANSDIFYNPSIQRRLPPAGARVMLEGLVAQHSNHCAVLNADADDFTVLVATNKGGFSELEQSLSSWLLEAGQGTTLAMLEKKGAVMTFDELAEGKCLEYKLQPVIFLDCSPDKVPIGDVGVLNYELAIRSFLEVLANNPNIFVRPLRITLFNLDGSNKRPYQGVKFGG
ncbi:unnamed protein product [Phytomonas sp. EM1]|nr:unnamed protein product [Phytomonas sp. EM1]|eukprot:CCW59921.1 unnamed protein product [Phytomonas sp. isolate EM1]